jgi:hypothetical protein
LSWLEAAHADDDGGDYGGKFIGGVEPPVRHAQEHLEHTLSDAGWAADLAPRVCDGLVQGHLGAQQRGHSRLQQHGLDEHANALREIQVALLFDAYTHTTRAR